MALVLNLSIIFAVPVLPDIEVILFDIERSVKLASAVDPIVPIEVLPILRSILCSETGKLSRRLYLYTAPVSPLSPGAPT